MILLHGTEFKLWKDNCCIEMNGWFGPFDHGFHGLSFPAAKDLFFANGPLLLSIINTK
jgi:hypothetical protein